MNAAPYGPKGREIQWTQPNGQKLTLRVFGDEFYGRTETLDGYTVVYSAKDKAYHYAELSGTKNSLLPSGGLADVKPKGLKKGIDLPVGRIAEIRRKNFERLGRDRDQRWNNRVRALRDLRDARMRGKDINGAASFAGINAAPVTGDNVGLTILAEFPDDPNTRSSDAIDFPASRSKMVRYCNEVGYDENGNTGSVRDYYFDQSDGKVTYTQKVTPIVTLPRARNFYNYADYPTNAVFRDTGEAGNMLIRDAVAELKASGFNFSGLTSDGGGNAIATNLFFAGQDSGVWAAGLWPHMSYLDTPINVGSLNLSGYQVTNIEDGAPVIGTFIHESGHLLCGFPDLYSYIDNGSVGYHCLMSAGNYNNDGKTPAPIDAYLKDTVGWANVVELSASDYIRRKLPSTGNVAYRVRNPDLLTESFVVENRGTGDRWAKYAVDKGIMIWHIDETLEGNSNRTGTDPHFGVALMQADGRMDLEQGLNYGDGGDLFEKGDVFTPGSSPDSDWWDGSNSGFRVKVLGKPSSSVSVQFGPLPPDTIIVSSPDGGELLYRSSKIDIKWEANVVGDLKIDLLKNEKFDQVIVRSTPNDGSFTWKVPANQTPGADYKIRISTITNPTPVSDKSDNDFAVTDSTFPASDSLPYGWYKPKEADSGYKVSKSNTFEGKYCLVSKPAPDGGMSAVAVDSNFEAGNVSFYLKVSSEVNYDFARFYIDGVAQKISGGDKGIAGRRDWMFVSIPVSAGKHTLMWTYEKDDSYGDGKDKAWLDAVQLPATRQEIDVKAPSGKSLVSNTSSFRFKTTKIGKVSKSKKITIKNVGKADLYGLSVATSGQNAKDFKVGKLSKKVLKPGQKATVSVRFAPRKAGSKKAKLLVMSNDVDESPFVIKLKGNGRGLPEIEVFQPRNHKLQDNKDTVNFGIAGVGGDGETLAFRVHNNGTGALNIQSIKISGSNRKDFTLSSPGKNVLAPLEATTFKVTFRPGAKNNRNAKLTIVTNDKKAGPFEIRLKGKGAPRRRASSPLAALAAGSGSSSASGAAASSEVSVMFVDGVKYRTLTVDKESVPSGLDPVVEVSGNLVDWFRGARHTTVVEDNAAILKVRDNTPLESGVKRHIRLRTLER
ncbi:MAG: M6 family metalloprotease domain-containing protein [Akkermansiaceae bacterium]|nr:M6 family metalloprotease domain-containing protein [Akkermansiaceae bacterium]